ncbi:hypothetical protein EV702DRAFT_1116912 [Suillus placidus]|uniref:Uncharacterized protein n=1 Tax=Suillus placidus TaxID=48579 RepID=A0A9P7D1B0_9AGAM|nr:hypothetical protein EV702DRAFT_1116912 [Suillus placidus]
MAIIDIFNAEIVQQVVDNLGGKHLVNSLITTVERLAQTTDTLSSDASTTLASTTLLVDNLITIVERLAQKTDAFSSDVNITLASTARLVENLIATADTLALNLHYLLQGCIALVALLCLLTVLCIVRHINQLSVSPLAAPLRSSIQAEKCDERQEFQRDW